MRQKWQTKKLFNVCSVDKRKYQGESLPYVGMEHIESGTGRFVGELNPVNVKSSTFRFGSNHLLYGRLRPYLNKVLLPEFEGHCSSEIFPIKVNADELDRRFLFYWITRSEIVSKINETSTGARMPRANVNQVLGFEIEIPSLSEQKRIVAILDEAFAGIDAAIANTEKNLANARELFESYLNSVFVQKDDRWVDTTIGSEMTLQRGFDITKKDQNPGDIPVVSSGGIKSYHDTAKAKAPGVVIGRKGSLGTVYFVESDYWPHDTTLWVKDFKTNNAKLVYYFLRSVDLRGLDTGTANPALNRNLVHPMRIFWPSRELHTSLVEALDFVGDETRRLEFIYRQKLSALAELKQSFLQKAFSGELTAGFVGNDIDEAVA